MVDVSAKEVTSRRAVAVGCLQLGSATASALEAALSGPSRKGDPFAVARIGAVNGAKRTSDLIPLAHPLLLTAITVDHRWDAQTRQAWFRAEVCTEGKTGVEMEALAAVSSGLLTLYDMLKAAGQDMALGPIRLLRKEGGRSGLHRNPWPECPWVE